MSRISHEQKQLYQAKIRAVISRDHQASQKEVRLRLEIEGLKLDRFYLAKLLKEIQVERIHRADRQTLTFALAAFEGTMTEIVKVAWEIAQSNWLNPKARVMALREIRETHNAVFEILFDAGVFDRKLGSLDATKRWRNNIITGSFQSGVGTPEDPLDQGLK
jgi:hypothetical protein